VTPGDHPKQDLQVQGRMVAGQIPLRRDRPK